MAKRKALSKKLRFEVFKRDSFKCQYCGRGAPEVVLHVDHIKPVKEGGDNSLFNLVTACQDCNSGKGARLLSKQTELKKQKEELDALNERREQIEMLMQWREGLKAVHDIEINAVNNAFQKATGYSFNEYGLTQISRLIKRYSLVELLEAIESLGFKFDPKKGDAIRFLNRLCQVEREKKECPYISDLYYIRGIIRNRFRDYERYQYYVIEYLKNVYGMGARLEEIKQVASTTSSWKEFTQYFSEVYE